MAVWLEVKVALPEAARETKEKFFPCCIFPPDSVTSSQSIRGFGKTVTALESHELSAELTSNPPKKGCVSQCCVETTEKHKVKKSRGDSEGEQVKRLNAQRGERGRHES